jgi:hypothetical protein
MSDQHIQLIPRYVLPDKEQPCMHCEKPADFDVVYPQQGVYMLLCEKHAEEHLPEHYKVLKERLDGYVRELLRNRWSREMLRKEMERRFPHSFGEAWESRVFHAHLAYLQKLSSQRKLPADLHAELRRVTRETKALFAEHPTRKL